jgi:hypothetical protein
MLSLNVILISFFSFSVFSTNLFLWDWDVNPMSNPQPGGPGFLSLSGTSLLTCPAWETLPVATLPPAHLLRSAVTSSFP